MFVEGKFNSKPISDFINTLSDEDLSILIQLDKDIFDRGIDGVEKAIADFKADPANIVEAEINTISLEKLQTRYEEIGKSVDTFVKNQKTVKSAFEELEKHGQLSADTIKSLIDSGYASALMYDETTGAVTLNTEAYEQLNKQKKTELLLDLQKQKFNLEKIYQDEIDKINEEATARNLLNGKVREYFILHQMSSNKTLKETGEQIAEIDGLINSLNAPTFDTDKNSKDPWKDEFDNLYSQKKHALEMNRISEEEYINWLDGAYKKYFSDLTKYQSEHDKYEEEVYKYRKDREQDLFDQKMDNYKKLADNALDKNVDGDGNEMTVSASFDYARSEINSAIEETQNRINELHLRPGFEDEIESLTKDLEDLNNKLDDINQKEIKAETDYIKGQKENYSDSMDSQIDSTEKEAKIIEKALEDKIDIIDKQSEAYDKQIDSIDKEIEAIEKVNEAEKRKADILEAQRNVKKAELELEKAHIKNRLVYTGNGQWEAREDKDAVKEAEENLAEAKAELAEKLQEQQTSLLEDQKNALEDQKDILEEQKNAFEEAKDNADKYYSDITDDLKEQKEIGEKSYDVLLDILENTGGEPKQRNSNTELYKRLTESGDIEKAVDNLSPTEYKAAVDRGILKFDDKGNYFVDYSAINDNSNVIKSNTEAIADLDETINKFMPDNSSIENAANADTKTNDTKVKPVTYSEWQKRHTLSEYAPHGKDVPDMTFEEYLSGKELKTETIKSDIKHYGANGIIPLSEIDISAISDRKTAEVVKALSAVSTGAFGNIGSSIIKDKIQRDPYTAPEIDVPVSSVTPQFNCTINIEGSADEKTVERMRSEMDSFMCEYTSALTRTINTEFMKRKYKA